MVGEQCSKSITEIYIILLNTVSDCLGEAFIHAFVYSMRVHNKRLYLNLEVEEGNSEEVTLELRSEE